MRFTKHLQEVYVGSLFLLLLLLRGCDGQRGGGGGSSGGGGGYSGGGSSSSGSSSSGSGSGGGGSSDGGAVVGIVFGCIGGFFALYILCAACNATVDSINSSTALNDQPLVGPSTPHEHKLTAKLIPGDERCTLCNQTSQIYKCTVSTCPHYKEKGTMYAECRRCYFIRIRLLRSKRDTLQNTTTQAHAASLIAPPPPPLPAPHNDDNDDHDPISITVNNPISAANTSPSSRTVSSPVGRNVPLGPLPLNPSSEHYIPITPVETVSYYPHASQYQCTVQKVVITDLGLNIDFCARITSNTAKLGELQDPEQSRLLLNGIRCIGPNIIYTKDQPWSTITGTMEFSVSNILKDWTKALRLEFIFGEPGADSYRPCHLFSMDTRFISKYNLHEIKWIKESKPLNNSIDIMADRSAAVMVRSPSSTVSNTGTTSSKTNPNYITPTYSGSLSPLPRSPSTPPYNNNDDRAMVHSPLGPPPGIINKK